MAEKSIKKNFVFHFIYQMVALLVPLIVTPYVSRVLGVDGIGEYSYANSIVSYFLLFAVLGTSTYGQRTIGYTQKNKEARSRVFWEVFIFRMLTVLITLGAYAGYFFIFLPQSSFTIYAILTLNIVNVIFDITWFMQGMEEFGKTVTASILFRILNVVFIFLFVKAATDLWIYIFITVGCTVLANVWLWMFLPKYLCRVKEIRPFRDTKCILQLFLPTIATQIYLVLDKSMIGWLTGGYTENGYYEQADKIVKMALTAVTALGVVTIPRIAKTYKEGDYEKVKYYIYKSYRYVWMMGIPIMFGMIAVSSIFVPVFMGGGYDKCIVLIPILSALMIFIGLSNVTGMQYFVPVGKHNVLTLTVLIGAVVNVILNAVLIPFFASIGAAIASVAAEFCVAMAGLIYIKRKRLYEWKPIFRSSWKYWTSGVVMFAVLLIVKRFLPVTLWALIVLMAIGVAVYFSMLLILRDQLIRESMTKLIPASHLRNKQSSEWTEETKDADEDVDPQTTQDKENEQNTGRGEEKNDL